VAQHKKLKTREQPTTETSCITNRPHTVHRIRRNMVQLYIL